MTDKLVLVIAGSGAKAVSSQVQSLLVARPGTPSPFLEIATLDSIQSLQEFAGINIASINAEQAARALAVAAHDRGEKLLGLTKSVQQGDSGEQLNIIGVGCVLSESIVDLPANHLPSSAETSIAVHSDRGTMSASLARANDRALDLLNHLLVKFGIRIPIESLDNTDSLKHAKIRHVCAPESFRDLIAGRITAIKDAGLSLKRTTWEEMHCWSCTREAPVLSNQLIFPGSFNPPHAGHQQMAQLASHEFGKPVICELAVRNAEKPPLDYISIRERIEWLSERGLAWIVTRTARFYEKADLFPESTFIVGADTAIRIADPKFYGNQVNARDRALAYFASRGCRFMVFGRATEGGFRSAEQLSLPHVMQEISYAVPEHRFRNDISSTLLRRVK